MIPQVVGIVFCVLWIYAVTYMRRATSAMPFLRETGAVTDTGGVELPLLSVVVPACNEERHIETALRSLLSQDYPSLELIVVNDRSTDATAEIVDRIAATDERVRPIHIESLPAGWLGKVHALHTGVGEASGSWLLFTDADVCFAPNALRLAVAYAARNGVDHLACVPEIGGSGAFWLGVAIRAFSLLFCLGMRLADVNREGSRRPIGIGAFNLVDAVRFRETPGFEWLRMEPADDLGVGVMLRKSGARSHVVHGEGLLSVPWYASLGEMIRGLEKNSFGPGASYSLLQQLGIVGLLWLFALVPVASALVGFAMPDPVLATGGTLAWLATFCVAIVMPRESRAEIFSYLLLPVGILIMSWIMLRAALICVHNGGIDWRGTHYAMAELRAGQRVRLGRVDHG